MGRFQEVLKTGKKKGQESSFGISIKAFFILLLLLIPNLLHAQNTGTLEGQVTDSTNAEPIIGVNVYISEISKGDASDINGFYRITQIPAGTYEVRFSYVSYKAKFITVEIEAGETTVLDVGMQPDYVIGEEVQVLAQAAGQVAAIKQQINSNTIVNVVSQEKLAELPDQNAAESVGRLPGVSVQRNAGEASKVVVRGLSPKFNSITVNGVRIPGTDPNDRSVDLSLVPSEVLSGIEVFKALTPDKDADAVGGTVNLLVRKAPEEFHGNASLEYGYNDLRQDFGQYKGSISLSDRFLDDKLGVLLTGSIQQANRSSELLNNDLLFNQADSTLRTENLNLADTRETRDRYGASLSMDYGISNSEFFLTSFMGRTDREELRRRKRYRVGNTRVEYDLRDIEKFDLLYTNSLRAEHKLSQVLIDWQVSHSYTLSKQPYGNYARFQELGAFESGLIDDQGPELIPQYARNNLDATWFQYGTFNTSRSTDRDLTAELNAKVLYELSRDINGYIKFGGKYRDKKRVVDQDELRTDFGVVSEIGQNNPDQFELYNNTHIAISNFIDEGYNNSDFLGGDYVLSPGLNEAGLSNFFSTYKNRYEVNRYTDLGDYTAGESIAAAYVMAEMKLGSRVTFIPGVRYEYTENFYEGNFGRLIGNLGQSGTLVDTTGGQSYSELLPQVHLKVNISDGIDFRVAYTHSLSRPDYYNLVPYEQINDAEQTLSRGNPDLKHTKAINYDAFVSFYNSRFGYFSVGAFYKELEDIDYVRVTRLTEGDYANYELTSPVNGEETTTVKGVEFDLQTDFRFLPKPLNGLILSANIAFIESETFFPFFKIGPRSPDPPYRPTIIDTVRSGKLPGQPDVTAALTVGYEIGLFSARLSLSHQKAILEEISTQSITDQLSAGFDFWDFRMNQSFRSMPGLTFFMNVNNVFSESERDFIGSGSNESRLTRDYNYGMNASAGVRYKF